MKITVNQIVLAYEKTGNGPPMILLHGNGENRHIFDELSGILRTSFTLYVIDSRNHGESEKTDVYDYGVMAEDVNAFIDALQLSDVRIVGFSDGAIIALLLALKGCPALHSMALLGVNLTPEDFTEESYQFVKDTYAQTQDPLFKLMLMQPQISLESVKTVQIPTLVIAGENDLFTPLSFERLATVLPHGELLVMPGHEHDSYIVHRSLLAPDLLKFLT